MALRRIPGLHSILTPHPLFFGPAALRQTPPRSGQGVAQRSCVLVGVTTLTSQEGRGSQEGAGVAALLHPRRRARPVSEGRHEGRHRPLHRLDALPRREPRPQASALAAHRGSLRAAPLSRPAPEDASGRGRVLDPARHRDAGGRRQGSRHGRRLPRLARLVPLLGEEGEADPPQPRLRAGLLRPPFNRAGEGQEVPERGPRHRPPRGDDGRVPPGRGDNSRTPGFASRRHSRSDGAIWRTG